MLLTPTKSVPALLADFVAILVISLYKHRNNPYCLTLDAIGLVACGFVALAIVIPSGLSPAALIVAIFLFIGAGVGHFVVSARKGEDSGLQSRLGE